MKAIRINNYGGPEVLSLEDVHQPQPDAGEVLVRIEAAGVNFVDVYQRQGIYAGELPFTPGLEAAGVVIALGDDVSGVCVGDRVAYGTHLGSYAQLAVVPSSKLVPIPDGMGIDMGAAVLVQGMTAPEKTVPREARPVPYLV